MTKPNDYIVYIESLKTIMSEKGRIDALCAMAKASKQNAWSLVSTIKHPVFILIGGKIKGEKLIVVLIF